MINSNFQKTVLPTGLRIVSEKISGICSIALGVWIEVGSRDEILTDNGISHFIEHMVFKGTKTRTTKEIAESMESVGGSLDAFTSKEITCYAAHFLDEHLSLAIDVLSDIIQYSLFDGQEIEKEKEVVFQEIYHYQDTPEDLVFEHFYNDIFGDHPLAYHIYGTIDNIQKFNQRELVNFIQRNYTANRIVIAAAGNVNHQQLVDLAAERFKNLQPGPQRLISSVKKINNGNHRIEHKCMQAHVCLGTRGLPYHSEKRFPLMILHTLLGGGMSSRLFQQIREAYGLAYTIFSFNDFYYDTGIFGIYLETSKENVTRSIDLIHKEFKKLVFNSIRADEINKAKQQLKGNLILSLENTFSRMNRLAKMEIYLQNFYTIDDIIRKIDEISANGVKEIAKDLFQEDQYFLTVLLPQD